MADALRALPREPDADALRLAVRQFLGVRAELRAAGCVERPAIQTPPVQPKPEGAKP